MKESTMDLSQLTELAHPYYMINSNSKLKVPGLSVILREKPSRIEALIYEPVLCLILQGSKVTSSGEQTVALHPGDALIVSHDLPVVSRITKATPKQPYLALLLSLDVSLLRSLYEQVSEAPLQKADARSLSKGKAEAGWLAPLLRYLQLMDNPMDAKVLGPATMREIHYRLLLSSIGGMLRHLLVADSHASRIAKAIQKLRAEYQSSLAVTDLAKAAGMSASSFHEHFKAVTGTTPLQYQKDLRLIEARNLMSATNHSVAETAYAVGYESPNHFSRDYSRKFGSPPSKEAKPLESPSEFVHA
jgi:AraC-like DNA-binding protein